MAQQQYSFGLGVSPDVLYVNGRGYIAFRAGDPRKRGSVQVYTWTGLDLSTLELIDRWDVPEGPAFPKVGRLNGEVCVGYTDGGRGWLRNLTTGKERDLGPMENNDPCTFGNESPWFAWQGAGRDGWPIERIDTFYGEPQGTGQFGRATGLSRVITNGWVVLVDDDGTSLRPCWSGDLRVWQGAEGGTGVQIESYPNGLLWAGQDRVTPRCASDNDENYAIAYWSAVERQVVLSTFTRAELLALGTAPAPPVVSIDRPLWCGFYEFTPATLPGNCQLPVDADMIVRTLDGDPLASHVSGTPDGDLDSLEARIVEARRLRPTLPVVCYWTRQAQAIRIPRGADIIGVEAYRRLEESVSAFESRVQASLNRVDASRMTDRVALVAQCYTSNPGNSADLVSLVPVYARLARTNPKIEMILAFSGSGRTTGYQENPEVWPLWTALAASVTTPGVPSVPEPQPHPQEPATMKPSITIVEPSFPVVGVTPLPIRCVYAVDDPQAGAVETVDWQSRRDGGEWASVTRPGAELAFTFTFTAPGTYEIRAIARNGVGSHTTGRQRLVRVNAAEQIPTPPPSEPTVELPDYAQFVEEEGREIDQLTRGDWGGIDTAVWRRLNEQWSHEQITADLNRQPVIGLVQVQRLTSLTYADWMAEAYQIRSAIKTQRTPTGGDMRHHGWRRFVEGWTLQNILRDIKGEPLVVEPPTPEPVPPTPEPPAPTPEPGPSTRRAGVVRADNRCFADDGGPYLALGTSLMWLLWGYKNDRERLTQNIKWLAERGVDYDRALGVVGPQYWSDRAIDPNDPDYITNLVGGIDLAWEHGLRTQLTIFGGVQTVPTPEGRRALVERIADALTDRREQIQFYEVANEHWQNGFPGESGKQELIALGRILQRTGNLVALSAAEDPNVAWLNEGWDGIATVHYDRADAPWRPIRQPWGYPNEYKEKGAERGTYRGGAMPTLAVNNEPIGPQSSVAADDNPFTLAFGFVTSFLAQNGAFCYHTGAGIRGGGIEDRNRGRAANVWEVPNAEATLAAFAALRAALPLDLPNWSRANAQWRAPNTEHPFEGFAEAVDAGSILRSFATVRGQEFWFLVLDLTRDVSARARRACTYEILDVRTCAVVSSATVAAGEASTFSRGLGLSGLLVRGRWV